MHHIVESVSILVLITLDNDIALAHWVSTCPWWSQDIIPVNATE